jgi:hypothetical protein
MKWLFLLCGIILGAFGAVGAMNFLTRLRAVADQNDQIIFAGKAFYNSEAVVTMTGTLTGPHLAYPNNTYNITCYRDRKECVVSSIEQIGHNQISTMYAPLTYPIVKWSTDEIIAKDETGPLPKLTGCLRTTITIERQEKSALWVEEPINQTDPFCKNADTNVNKYTIEDAPGWKRIFAKSPR